VGKAHDCEVSRERYKDTDPVNLVFMFAFPERALIILRGKIDHIRQAKRVIREYDVPAPMARVTLWSLEMNSDATPKGTKHLNAALAAIDEEFALTRAQVTWMTQCPVWRCAIPRSSGISPILPSCVRPWVSTPTIHCMVSTC